jgi:hypothetical protein
MGKARKTTIAVQGTAITVLAFEEGDYISLTDMLKAKDGDFFISDWLRNRNTVEFLGIWESVHNPAFKYGEFAIIKSNAGLNSYKISVKEWVEKTNAVGLRASAGRYGGTFAHKDIAFEFGMWISPVKPICSMLPSLGKLPKNGVWITRKPRAISAIMRHWSSWWC